MGTIHILFYCLIRLSLVCIHFVHSITFYNSVDLCHLKLYFHLY